jgi:nucleoside-diphosphate-sugar epimerase
MSHGGRMRALVTGGAGFIGSNLTVGLLDRGYRVDVIDNLSNGYIRFVPERLRDDNFFAHDFSSDFVLDKVRNKDYDVVFHLAAMPRVSYSVEHPVETNDINVSRTLRLLDACRGNVKRVVFASSSSVYGLADSLPTKTSTPKNPKSPYALQKSIIEDYLKMYHNLYGLDSVCLRFFNVFGKNQLGDSPYSTAVSAWLTAIMKGVSMRSDGDGSQSRDMCHVDNVVDACVKSAETEMVLTAEPLNVSCGDRTTNKEILQFLLKRFPGSKYHDAPWRLGDVMHTQADISRTFDLIGYRPIVRFWEGLEMTIDWYEKNWDSIKELGK